MRILSLILCLCFTIQAGANIHQEREQLQETLVTQNEKEFSEVINFYEKEGYEIAFWGPVIGGCIIAIAIIWAELRQDKVVIEQCTEKEV